MRPAFYVRVSTADQDPQLQLDAIRRWAEANSVSSTTLAVNLFTDHASGKDMDRPAWVKLAGRLRAGQYDTLVVWKLDRLGRTTLGLLQLWEKLEALGVRFVSLTENLDLGTPAGKMFATILAGAAQYEREISRERQTAGIEAKRQANGGTCPWGGSTAGGIKAKPEKVEAVKQLLANGTKVKTTARLVGCSPKFVRKIRDREPPHGNVD